MKNSKKLSNWTLKLESTQVILYKAQILYYKDVFTKN